MGVSDRCAKTVHDTDRCTNIGCVTKGVQKLGMTGVKNLGVSNRCAKNGHDRCAKTRCE